ncbi:MAG: hypothetical protein AB1726_03605 [Planctomycetota bacterium]
MNDANRTSGGKNAAQPVSGCFVRLGWLLVGNATMLVLLLTILQQPSWSLTWRDIAFWLVLGATIALRHIDAKRFCGTTMEDEPATPRSLRRYTIALAAAAALLWTLGQSFKVLG